MSRRGITLLELLSVLGILSLLMGLLAPTLAGAREAAWRAACLSNVRQVGMANIFYAKDHQNRFVAGAPRIAAENLHRWHGARQRVGEPFDPARGDLTPYLDSPSADEGVRACPAFDATLDELRASGMGFEFGAGGYGYNNAFVGVERALDAAGVWRVRTDETGSLTHRFAQPVRTIAFADAAFTGRERLIEYSFIEPRFWPDSPAFRPDPSMHFRHAERANIAWLDGHASGEARTFSWEGWFSRLDARRVGLGWTGGEDSNALFDYD